MLKEIIDLSTTPTLSEGVYSQLPEFLKKCVGHFDNDRERDVVLLSSITILSGCFSKVKGKYDKDFVGPNLYSFIVAPAASGKGVMKYAKLLGQPIQDQYMANNKQAMEGYKTELKEWEKAKRDGKESGNKPTKPKCPVLFIPGNSSSASVYNLLDESNGIGIMMETEADTLANTMKQDWGNYSDMFRKAFHHESLSLSRKTDYEYVEINNPRLSILLSGTISQVPRLIASAEDGLSSRFNYYTYSRHVEWLDPSPCGDCPDISIEFKRLGAEVLAMKEKLDTGFYTFGLTKSQFSLLSNFFSAKLDQIRRFEGDKAANAVYRLGLICFRLAMILSILRKINDLPIVSDIECGDQDINVALEICEVLFEHSMVMYSMLPKQERTNLSPKLRQFYTALPNGTEFQRKDANTIGAKLSIADRTVGNYLLILTTMNLLEKSAEFGKYKKTDVEKEG